MNKADLIDQIAEKTQTSKAAAARVFEAIFDASSGAIAEAVQAGKHVSIPGFGKFRSKERAARKGRNPQTGTEIDIPASTVVSFAAAKTLRETVKSGGGSGAATRGTAAKSAGKGAAAAKSGAKPAKSTSAAKSPARSSVARSAPAKTAGKSGGASSSTAERSSGGSKAPSKTAAKSAPAKTASKSTAAKSSGAAAKKSALKK